MSALEEQKTAVLNKAVAELADIWQLTESQCRTVMGLGNRGDVAREKKVLCLKIHTRLSALFSKSTEQRNWLANSTTPDSPLKGQSPLSVMEQGLSGVKIVDGYLAQRVSP